MLSNVDVGALADLAIAVWRIERRAKRSPATPEAVLVACESACDRLRALGVKIEDLTGASYDIGMRVRVVEGKVAEGGRATRISECLSPAVYVNDELVRPAEVTVEGERHG